MIDPGPMPPKEAPAPHLAVPAHPDTAASGGDIRPAEKTIVLPTLPARNEAVGDNGVAGADHSGTLRS